MTTEHWHGHLLRLGSALLTGVMLFLCFPRFEADLLVWFTLVPLMLAALGRSGRAGYLLGLAGGAIFNLGLFAWILEVPEYTGLHHFLLAVYFGSYLGLFALAVASASRRMGAAAGLWLAPFFWVALEYLRGHFFFLALPWGFLAHTQYKNPAVIQVATFAGAYGVSFLIVLVNAGLVALLLIIAGQVHWPCIPRLRIAPGAGIILVAGVALAAALLHGHRAESVPVTGEKIAVSLVQGNIEQSKKWDPAQAEFILDTYFKMTAEAAAQSTPAIVVWPESATPRAIDGSRELFGRIARLADDSGAHLLLGSSHHLKFRKGEQSPQKFTNSVYLFPPAGPSRKIQRYDKIRLFPFGEFLPEKAWFPWSLIGVPDVAGYKPGSEWVLFEMPGCRFAATICWENIFPEHVRTSVKKGAQLIVNLANEAWFGDSAAPHQFLSSSVMRAVENRVYVVRCVNTGISCVIGPHGRILGRVSDAGGKEVFVQGILNGTVIPLDKKTFYTKYGDWLVWLCGTVSLTALLMKRRKGREAKKRSGDKSDYKIRDRSFL